MKMRKDTAVRQKEIVQVARKLITQYGSENVTVRKIAAEIGVSEGAIYRHFRSKREILSIMIDDVEDTLVGDIAIYQDQIISSRSGLEEALLNQITVIEQRKGVSFQVIAEIISLGDKRLNKKAYLVICRYLEILQTIISNCINSGVVKPAVDPAAAARMYFSLTQGLVNVWALSGYQTNLFKEYQDMLRFYLDAIAK
jgi:AcrR family transcriptional regulator